jgi:hypothetical protein
MGTDRLEFPLKRSLLASLLVRPLAWGPLVAVLEDEYLTLKMGWLGHARVPLRQIDRLGTMRWPWWAGAGVRISKNLVVFAPSTGRVVLVGLSTPARVRAPMPWTTGRLAVAVEDLDGFMDEIAYRRGGLPRMDGEI